MIKVSMHVCLYIAVYSFCFATLYAATVMSTGSFGSFVCSSGCQVVSILHLLGSLTQLTADSIPPLTTPPTEDTILGFEVSAGPPLGATATSTAPVTSTWELTLEGWQGGTYELHDVLFKGSFLSLPLLAVPKHQPSVLLLILRPSPHLAVHNTVSCGTGKL